MTNSRKKTGRGSTKSYDINGLNISLLAANEGIKYLGRLLCFNDFQNAELQNRIRVGWAKFSQFRQELTSKYYTLNSRLRLFANVVTPSVMYGAGTWTLTREQETLLMRTERRMLRMILTAPRKRQPHHNTPANTKQPFNDLEDGHQEHLGDDTSSHDVDSNPEQVAIPCDVDLPDDLEPWPVWIHRVTHQVEDRMKLLHLRSWV
eukprot:543634-Karenia_brevis.AAC.1